MMRPMLGRRCRVKICPWYYTDSKGKRSAKRKERLRDAREVEAEIDAGRVRQ